MRSASSVDATHDPALRSWVSSANDPATDFPIQSLPLGVFRRRGKQPAIGVAIGDMVLDLSACARAKVFSGEVRKAGELFAADSLNGIFARGAELRRALRKALVEFLEEGNKAAAKRAKSLTVPQSAIEMLLPARIGDYSDFYASIHHATNVGSMFRPDNPLLPNYKFVPIGYHGRASSIVVSGTQVRRPKGQTKDETRPAPDFGPTRRLDYELEVGAFIGSRSTMGAGIPIARAEDHLWGLCLLNDWSARDIQTWEYQPLGPFLAKNFATTISPWVVTMEALAPFRVPSWSRPAGDPAPLPYLDSPADRAGGGIGLTLEVWLRSATMRAQRLPPMMVSRGTFAQMYWTFAQLVTHHASGGCNLEPGDLFGSGTVSNAMPESRGCLLERAWRGTEPLALSTGEKRSFLEDGDEVTLRGYAERDGRRRIGLGECSGVIAPAT